MYIYIYYIYIYCKNKPIPCETTTASAAFFCSPTPVARQEALLQASRPEGVDLLDAAVQPFLVIGDQRKKCCELMRFYGDLMGISGP